MQATRTRLHLGPAVEWVVAIVFLLSTLGVASLILRELRTAPPAQPIAAAPTTALPAAVPQRAVSVPSLMLLDGRQILSAIRWPGWTRSRAGPQQEADR